ncbi:SRPBCC domain-containing protein [Jiangella alba]|uniref:Uncharacterized conserved protein YndB, AHSA1/START domain n=1 Tax=Jiangella alba TaxID=561176 RepID=A0A1H5PX24_9ACTN|nr:SRPBCC domain-containing protein [Jiangella alba]SEF18400.1 Uncharacterized conserved protein YndB, AHSA1/START domain [Jiangella alba]
MSSVPPLRREIVVAATPDVAFDVFTSGIGRWWPLAELSVHGERAGSVAFVDGVIVERSDTGEEAVWGTVTRWEPPGEIAFSWHPGRPADVAGLVEVGFAAVEGGTLVTLRHSGWESYADPAAARAEYDHGWPTVLGRYAEEAARAGGGTTWALLLHRAADDVAGSVFDDPRFAEHVAFLGRRRAAGQLVAAGPLGDAAGEGLTVLRLPGAGRLAEIVRLATEDDLSVRDGLFTVTVRPWRVTLSGPAVHP